MADAADKSNSPAADSGSGSPEATPRPRFKTNNVNLMFRQTASDSGDGTGTGDKSSPGTSRASSAGVSLTSKTNSSTHRGRFTLAAKRDHSGASTPAPPPAIPQPSQPQTSSAGAAGTSHTAAAASAPNGSETTTQAGTTDSGSEPKPAATKPRKPSIDYTEEELSNRGISVAGRFHSASNVNWEDEEEDWNPPPQATSIGASFLSTVKSGKPSAAPSHSGTEKSAASTAKPAVSKPATSATITERPASSSTASSAAGTAGNANTPWGQRKVTTTKSLGDAIREAKEKGGDSMLGLRSGMGRGHYAAYHHSPAAASGGDALSRFRIRSGAVMGSDRGLPPLNPRGVPEDEPLTFQKATDRGGFNDFGHFGRPQHRAPFPSEEDVFMFSRPRNPVANEGGAMHTELPISPPVTTPRPIPDRLRRGSTGATLEKKPTASATPSATATAGTAAHTAASTAPSAAAQKHEAKPAPAAAETTSEKSTTAPKQDSEPALKSQENTTEQTTAKPRETASTEVEHAAKDEAKPKPETTAADTKPDATTADSEASAETPAPKVDADGAPVVQEQKLEMDSGLAAAKARLEAERAEEREKERQLREKREQMRQELENKKHEEEARKNARKEELQRKYEELEKRRARSKAEHEARVEAQRREREERRAQEKAAKAELKRKQKEEREARKLEEAKKHTEENASASVDESKSTEAATKTAEDALHALHSNPRGRFQAEMGSRRDVQGTYPSRLLRVPNLPEGPRSQRVEASAQSWKERKAGDAQETRGITRSDTRGNRSDTRSDRSDTRSDRSDARTDVRTETRSDRRSELKIKLPKSNQEKPASGRLDVDQIWNLPPAQGFALQSDRHSPELKGRSHSSANGTSFVIKIPLQATEVAVNIPRKFNHEFKPKPFKKKFFGKKPAAHRSF